MVADVAESKQITLFHKKAADFKSVSAQGAVLSGQPDGSFQIVFYTLVTDVEKEHFTLEPIDDAGISNRAHTTGFETNSYREDSVRVVMSADTARDMWRLLNDRFGSAPGKGNGGGHG